MKIVYMGTPEFSKTCLNELITNNFDIRLVITNEDKKTGRGMKQMKTPVKILAEENSIEVWLYKCTSVHFFQNIGGHLQYNNLF